jgi:hypothetical protein
MFHVEPLAPRHEELVCGWSRSPGLFGALPIEGDSRIDIYYRPSNGSGSFTGPADDCGEPS